MAKKGTGYFGLGWVVSLILAIFFVPQFIFGLIICAQRKKWLFLVLRILLFPIMWIVDIVTLILYGNVTILV